MAGRVSSPFPPAKAARVLVADGAMGTTLRSQNVGLDDFAARSAATRS